MPIYLALAFGLDDFGARCGVVVIGRLKLNRDRDFV
jgi:hypothetical protein